MIVSLGQAGLHIDSTFVPDISVGQHWAKHWVAIDGDAQFGGRQKFDHNYPDYFPQAVTNPQESWCYPNSGLGEFRRWVEDDYVKAGKFGKYLETKVKQGTLPPSFAQLAVAALTHDE